MGARRAALRRQLTASRRSGDLRALLGQFRAKSALASTQRGPQGLGRAPATQAPDLVASWKKSDLGPGSPEVCPRLPAPAAPRRRHGGGIRGLRLQRAGLHLPDHACHAHGRRLRGLGGERQEEPLRGALPGHPDAERGWGSWRPSRRVVDVGTLATTFTSSQGLLLMIPNMYILAGALNPCVIHVAARALTKHALCIFGDHTDVMAVRQTGFAILSAHNVQEVMDMSLAAHVATLKSSVPFVCFQDDGFRTSHEINKPEVIPYEAMAQLVPWEDIHKYRRRGLHPNRPHARQQGQFSDTFFQNAEASNLYYDAVPGIVQSTLDDIGAITGRYYKIFDYKGHPEAEHVIVSMGSSCNVINEVVKVEQEKGVKVGQVNVHLFRPWDSTSFINSLPPTVKTVTVLDRTKESGSREPLFLDVASTMQTAQVPVTVLGGRYGLGQKDLTPGMVLAVFENSRKEMPKDGFTIGIDDDVTHTSLKPQQEPVLCPPGTKQCLFWGMGSDGTLSANKNAIKLIGTQTDQHVQAHFVYDSKKAGGCTVSHLRFGPERIESSYNIMSADFISCSQSTWVPKFKDQLWATIAPGGTCVLNIAQKTSEEVSEVLPAVMKRIAAERDIKLYTIDANAVAKACGLGRHTNNILTAVFFKLSDVLDVDEAISLFKDSMRKSYKAKGKDIVERNLKAVDQAFENLNRIHFPKEEWLAAVDDTPVDPGRPAFCTEVMDRMSALDADSLPVSAFDPRGHFPTATTMYEKRSFALSVPVTDMDKCTQCNKCAAICPHAAIRPFLISQVEADKAPQTFEMVKAKGGIETAGLMYRIQVAPDDCTGCQACSNTCGDGALTMTPLPEVVNMEQSNWDFGIKLPDRGSYVEKSTVKGAMFQKPMLEFSGACEGCGETPYAKLATQLFGERLLIANASGCSSVWSGTAAFSPFAKNDHGQGPAYGRSLFEDAAEYGLGMAKSIKQRREQLGNRVSSLLNSEEHELVLGLLPARLRENMAEWLMHKEDPEISQRLARAIKEDLKGVQDGTLASAKKGGKTLASKAGSMDMFRNSVTAKVDTNTEILRSAPIMQEIFSMDDSFVKVSPWIWGGDGWAYDIGFGGLDHVLAQSRDINLNVLIMDTEGYSNTGGQVSKATNYGSVQKFAPAGYRLAKKDLGAIAMSYEHVYVGSMAIGADYGQCVKSFLEAEAVEAGYWTLYRYNPALRLKGENPFRLDSKRLTRTVEEFTSTENRFMTLTRTNPEAAEQMKGALQEFVQRRHDKFTRMAAGEDVGATTGVPLTILVGSDTGTAAELALRTKKMCEARNYNVTIMDLDEIGSAEDLSDHKNVLVLCSTAGEGDMPGTATKFWDTFCEGAYAPDALAGMQYHVFGLGDRGYRHFNKAAKQIDAKFEELGAERRQPVGLGDDQDDDDKYETALDEWLPEFWKIQDDAPEPADADKIPDPMFELTPVPSSEWSYRQIAPPGTKMITLEQKRANHARGSRPHHPAFELRHRGQGLLISAGRRTEHLPSERPGPRAPVP
ncbi:unnamed protein product [Prorocentrum cordatum]|uniref:Uncharacterized protein n=1 Tax=Prorocentrum cordatum TaxID=2364126 RepID=A0ABN9WGX3_9DINO|nr:unnamed protein product [Polarella glacialis]